MKITKSIICACISGIISLVILSGFVLFYGFSGIHIENPSGATDYKWESYQLKTTMTEGFAWLKLDEDGFNNPDVISTQSPDILIMGSSHMEAINIPQCDNTSVQIQELLPEMSVYNIGTSGHTIYTCAKNMKAAVVEYEPRQYVVLETDSVSLDNRKMKEVLDGILQTIPSYDSGIVYYAQKYCPAIKSIYKKIEDWRSAGSSDEEKTPTMNSDDGILAQFLQKMRTECGDRKLIIFFHPRTKIDEFGNLLCTWDGIEAFKSACAANDIIFVDMTEDFQKLYDESHILAHGFINSAVGVGHLNKYGHMVIAKRLAEVILEDKQK